MRWNWNAPRATGVGEAAGNVWSRAYRREHERKMREAAAAAAAAGTEDGEMRDPFEDRRVALAFRIRVMGDSKEVVVEWLRGSDRVLWESFCGMVHRSFKKS